MQYQSSKLFIQTICRREPFHVRIGFFFHLHPSPLLTFLRNPDRHCGLQFITLRHGAPKDISVGNLARKRDFQLTDWFNSTGATGYIGGDVLYAVSQTHPDWQVSVLVRNKDKAAKLSSEYPNARVVLGDLDSSTVIEEETKNANIVLSASIMLLATINPTGT